MGKKERFISAIDVGSSKICALTAEVGSDGILRIVGVGVTPSRGIRNGKVVDIEEAASAVASAVDKANRMAGVPMDMAAVGVACSHISSVNVRGMATITHGDHIITQEDVDRTIENARTAVIPTNREIIHVIPREFSIDGQGGVRNPVGMVGFRLEVEAHIVTGSTTSIQNLIRCVEKAGVKVGDLILQPLAAGEAVLTAEEKEMGVLLADIGGGITDLAVFENGSILYSMPMQVSGSYLTNDVAIGLRTSAATAEEAKITYGHAMSYVIEDTDTVELVTFGSKERQVVQRKRLAQIIQARAEEIFALMLAEVRRAGYDGLLPAGIVLTGGTAALRGIAELGRDYTQLPVRVGYPRGVGGLVDAISGPAYAASVGLLLWSYAAGSTEEHEERQAGLPLWRRLWDWLRGFMP